MSHITIADNKLGDKWKKRLSVHLEMLEDFYAKSKYIAHVLSVS